MNNYEGYVDLQGQSSIRVDLYITDYLKIFSRSQLKSRKTVITINGKPSKFSQKVRGGDLIAINWHHQELFFEKEDLPLNIIYEDAHVWVINKDQGMAVHPGAGRTKGTVANALAYLMGSAEHEFGDSIRPGIVHRLDMDTSGVLICAKTAEAHAFLADQFKRRTTKKRYMAIIQGHIHPPTATIANYMARSRRHRKLFTCGDDNLRGKRAITSYRVLRSDGPNDLVLFKPHTGRTHQLRVHAGYLDHPIVGDVLYNRSQTGQGLMLHAWKLKILLPGQTEAHIFCAPVPNRFYNCLGLAIKDR